MHSEILWKQEQIISRKVFFQNVIFVLKLCSGNIYFILFVKYFFSVFSYKFGAIWRFTEITFLKRLTICVTIFLNSFFFLNWSFHGLIFNSIRHFASDKFIFFAKFFSFRCWKDGLLRFFFYSNNIQKSWETDMNRNRFYKCSF